MPSVKKDQSDSPYANFSFEERLQALADGEKDQLLHYLMGQDPEVKRHVLEWFKSGVRNANDEEGGNQDGAVDEALLWEYWRNAEVIISDFNSYGGGSDEDQEKAYDWPYDISKLIEGGKISTDAKLNFLDNAFEEYDRNNSGFEYSLMELFFELCETIEEWEYLLMKLEAHPSRSRNSYIMEIQRKYLHDSEAYLNTRRANLTYGMDYWELIEYYLEHDELENALATAEQGVAEGEGALIQLFQFLFDNYAKANDERNLERIVGISLARRTVQRTMLHNMFEYYKKRGNYEKARDALANACMFTQGSDLYDEYQTMKGFLSDHDWAEIEPLIFNEIQTKDIHVYLRICYDKNMKKEMIDIITHVPKNRWGGLMLNDYDEFADKLMADYPKEIIEYYWQRAYVQIPRGNRKTYQTAAEYLKKVRHIYATILQDEAGWNARFSALRMKYKNRPAFQDEMNAVGTALQKQRGAVLDEY